jgi:ribosomal protein S20
MNVFFIISIICLAFCLIIFFYLKWYVKKRTFTSGLEEYRTETAKLIVDINSVTDRNLQLVEDSISKLKTLMKETEERIEEYKNVIEIKPAKESLYTNLGRSIRAALINTGDQMPPQTERPLQSRQLSLELQTFDELHEIPENSESKITAATLPVSEKQASQKSASLKQLRSAIDLLVSEGVSPEEIASRLNISIAQVNLAMNLRRKKR